MDSELDSALRMFDLDGSIITKESLKKAYHTLARKHHPDTCANYKDKLSATERFQTIVSERDRLEAALADGILPIAPKNLLPKRGGPWDSEPEPRPKNKAKYQDPFDQHRSPRERFDKKNIKPSERLMNIPIIGPIFATVMIVGMMASMIGGVVIIFPFWILYGIASATLPRKATAWITLNKLPGFSTTIPVLCLGYPLSYVGIALCVHEGQAIFMALLLTTWAMISLMILDEIYSIIRFQILKRKLGTELGAFDQTASD